MDISEFDNTSGGYEPPYEDFTGEPLNFDEMDISATGFVGRGYVINAHLNCHTGMISIELYGQMINYRVFSERALAVHQPQVACAANGFDPQFQ